MLLLILKSSACLATFMIFYKLFLEKESMHSFKRLYLLGALLVSIVIPFITFTQYIEVAVVEDFVPFQSTEFSVDSAPKTTTWQDYIPTSLWTLYILGVIVFGFRFAKNLKDIVSKIKTNPKHKYHSFINVLLQDLIPPHTFFNYIFVNKTKYEHSLIPKEVLLHEQTHAKQKHALDVLIIEILQIVFWFNPLIYLIKKDIKLNHEFLADRAVLDKGITALQYKETLLAFSSNAKEPMLANAINYSSIKKRFTVMKTKTSKKAFWLRSLLLLPMLAILIYSFSNKLEIQKETSLNNSFNEINISNSDIKIYIDNNRDVLLNGKSIAFNSLYKELKNFINILNPKGISTIKVFIEIEEGVTLKLLQNIKKQIQRTGLKVYEIKASYIVIDEKEFEDSYKQTNLFFKGTYFTGDSILVKTKKGEVVKGKSVETNEKSNFFFGEVDITTQQKATKEQIAEYNKLAKKYNTLLKNENGIIIKQSIINRLNHLYNLMSDEQRKNAEPFPKIAPPPPPKSLKKVLKNGETIKIREVSPPSTPKKLQIIKAKEVPLSPKSLKRVLETIEVKEVPLPPVPKTPQIMEVKEEPPLMSVLTYPTLVQKNAKITSNIITVPSGEEFQIILSDGTKVFLKSETQLKYPTKFIKGQPRKVELVHGEAFFDVASNKEYNSNFIVVTEGKEINVSRKELIGE